MMPLPKESYYGGDFLKKPSDKFIVLIGGIGAAILLFSWHLASPQIGYIIGSSCLLLAAIYFKLIFFIALEMILIAGHSAILLGIGPNLQIALPCLLSFQLFIYYLISGQLKNIFLFIGLSGIATLSVGFAYNNDLIFFIGSSAIAVYAFYNAKKGVIPSYLWAILNLIFALISLFEVMT